MLDMFVEICFISVSQIGSLLLTCSCRPIPRYNQNNQMIQSELTENATYYQA